MTREEWTRQRAKELWENAGYPANRDEEFWLTAEQEYDSIHICMVSPWSCPYQIEKPGNGGKHTAICGLDKPGCGNIVENE